MAIAKSAELATAPVARPSSDTASFNFYGVGLAVSSSAPKVLEYLARDFEYFAASTAGPGIELRAHAGVPPWERIPERIAAMVTPNAISYDDGPVRYNDYHRQALAICDFNHERGEIWALTEDLLYEITYLMALSRIGEAHDLRGIHRVHALGVAVAGKGTLVLLPEAGGKTTLALELLKYPEVELLSDDTPLVERGMLRAFPTRLGIRGDCDYGIDPSHIRTMNRRSGGPKTLVDFSHFRDRVVAQARPHALVVGVRSSGTASRIEPISRVRGLPVLTANLVFGLGLPQVVEFFLRGGVFELFRKASIVGSRVGASLRLSAQTRCYRLVLGRDIEAAARALRSVL